MDSAERGYSFLQRLQLDEGHWACSYGGPSFLLPGIIFAAFITETPVPDEWTIEMARYLRHHANDDGGWGLHLEGPSTVFATGLYYVMLRLLGFDPADPLLAKSRECLLALGKYLSCREILTLTSSPYSQVELLEYHNGARSG